MSKTEDEVLTALAVRVGLKRATLEVNSACPDETILFVDSNNFYRNHPKRKDGKWDMRYSINHEKPWRKFDPKYDR